MSLNTGQSVKCPKCGQLSKTTVWSSITVKDSPDLKRDLLEGRINIFRCPNCGERGLMPQPLLYNDEDGRLLIAFSPAEDDLTKRRLFEKLQDASRESGELERYEGYNLRFVSDYNSMLEKLLIFDSGLNDKAIEVLKLLILWDEPEKSEQRRCRFGKAESGEMEFMVQDLKEEQIYTSRVPQSSYDAIWRSLRESGVKPYSFGWETVDADYASRLLNGINN